MLHNKWLQNVVTENNNHFVIHGFCGSEIWTKHSRDGLCLPHMCRILAEEIWRLGMTWRLGLLDSDTLCLGRADLTMPPRAPIYGFSLWFEPHSYRVIRLLTCWLRAPSTRVLMNRTEAASPFIAQTQTSHNIISTILYWWIPMCHRPA